jgi:AraC family transcriptional regulator, alkane utilization regulator
MLTMDVLSDALRVIRLKGSLYLSAEFREPWCVSAPGGAELPPILALDRDHVAICHLMIEGRCWVKLPECEAVPLLAGDVVVLPHGDAHLIGSGTQHAAMSANHALKIKVPDLNNMRYGGDGDATHIVCGWFAYERDVTSPVISALPRLFRTGLRARPSGAWLESAIRYALSEATSGQPGADVVSDKLAEMLFVEALRGYIESAPDQPAGWIAGMRDPLIARSIALLHERPAEPWTVASLAQAVYVSRTVLAERFTATVGIPPMQYLTQWRFVLAANLLRSGRLSLSRIAEEIGYESESAFSRAFKREVGTAPGTWRQEGRGASVQSG